MRGALILLGCVVSSSANIPLASRPNLIFILLDDHSTLDEGLSVMPHYAQRFRDEGMRMSNAFVSSPKCCPSRTSLLSGRFAHRLADDVDGWCGDFSAAGRYNGTWIGELQRDYGYRVGYFGKYINTMTALCPKKGGVGIVPSDFNVSAGDAFVAQCTEAYYNVTWSLNGKIVTTGDGPSDYAAAYLGNHSIPWLHSAAQASATGAAPFFAFLAPHAPHLPATPAPWHINAPLPADALTAPRVPSYNAFSSGKSWNVEQNAATPFSDFTKAGIDAHARNRARTLLSVDDYVLDIFNVLEAANIIESTYVIMTSDHGYHLGNFGLPFEKSTTYDIDVRIPFYVRGPGVPKNASALGPISLMDIGPTFLELAGKPAGGKRVSDGVSFAPLLKAAGAPPPGWRDGVLIEHISEVNQWMNVCDTIWNVSGCPAAATDVDPFYLIDGPQNTWASWRVLNASHNFLFTAFRPQGSAPTRENTNWTELYDLNKDPWQGVNLANVSDLTAYEAGLWAIANCSLNTCP